jgi:5'-3' exonuclease
MTNYILIDGSYFIFYRVFALQVWWKNAKPNSPLINPFTNDEFLEKFESTFKSKIKEIKKKLKLKEEPIIYVGKDCFQKDIWRKEIYPEYKQGRNEEKNKEANIGNFFEYVYENNLFIESGANKIIECPNLEADDCLALTSKLLYNKSNENMIYIITSDHDYIQLANDRIHLYNLQFKSLLSSSKYCGDPKKQLFKKIVQGDKSDNILSIFKKCGPKTIDNFYLNRETFIEKLKRENKMEVYIKNQRLIDFNEIPFKYIKKFHEINLF